MVDTLRCTDSVGGYACQLSCIVRESHACRLKTSISYFKDSFSNLPHKSRQIVLKYVMSDKSLIQFPQLIFQALNDDFVFQQNQNTLKLVSFTPVLKVLKGRQNIFASFREGPQGSRKCTENLGSSLGRS